MDNFADTGFLSLHNTLHSPKVEKGSLRNNFFSKIHPDLSYTMQKVWENAFGGETFQKMQHGTP